MDLATASRDELVELLRTKYGVNPSKHRNKHELLEKLFELGEQRVEPVAGRGRPSKAALAAEKAKRPKTVVINIAPTQDRTRNTDVFVGCNGRTWLIKRGVDVEVPYGCYESLNNAVATGYRQNDDGTVTAYQYHNYPFSVVEKIYE